MSDSGDLNGNAVAKSWFGLLKRQRLLRYFYAVRWGHGCARSTTSNASQIDVFSTRRQVG